MFNFTDKTHEFIKKYGYKPEDFDDYQLECIQDLANRNLDGTKFVNPKIDGLIMDKVLFAMVEDSRYVQVLPYMTEYFKFGTLSKILMFKEQNKLDAINQLIYIWKDLPHSDKRKTQLQMLIYRGIEFPDNLYTCPDEEFEYLYTQLNMKHLGLYYKLSNYYEETRNVQ